MIYLYSYFAITAITCIIWAFYFKSRWEDMDWFDRATALAQITFAGATAAMIGLLHSWTSEGFGYFAAVLRALGVAV